MRTPIGLFFFLNEKIIISGKRVEIFSPPLVRVTLMPKVFFSFKFSIAIHLPKKREKNHTLGPLPSLYYVLRMIT